MLGVVTAIGIVCKHTQMILGIVLSISQMDCPKWALFSHDEYLVQVHDMGAWLDRLINHTLEKHVELQHVAPPSMAQLKAVIWMDGGKSAGRKMSKVCLCIGCLCEPCGLVVVASHLVEMV